MRAARVVVALFVLAACAPPPKRELAAPYELRPTAYSLPKKEPGHVSSRDYYQISAGIVEIQPRFKRAILSDVQERDVTYRQWSALLLDARALDWSKYGEEQRLGTFGELYREGDSLEVYGAAELADQNLSECLAKFPLSLACNTSAVAFDLASRLTPDRIARVERSLAVLSQERRPEIREFVEAELVYLRMLQRDAPRAQSAIDTYLEDFPNGQAAEQFRRALPGLEESLERAPELEP